MLICSVEKEIKMFYIVTPLRYISPWPLSALLRLINGTKRAASIKSSAARGYRVLYCNTRNSRSYSQNKLKVLSCTHKIELVSSQDTLIERKKK